MVPIRVKDLDKLTAWSVSCCRLYTRAVDKDGVLQASNVWVLLAEKVLCGIDEQIIQPLGSGQQDVPVLLCQLESTKFNPLSVNLCIILSCKEPSYNNAEGDDLVVEQEGAAQSSDVISCMHAKLTIMHACVVKNI